MQLRPLSFIIHCLNCIRRDRNSTYKTGLKADFQSSYEAPRSSLRVHPWALSSNHNAKQLILIRCKHSQRAARSFVRGLAWALSSNHNAKQLILISARCEELRARTGNPPLGAVYMSPTGRAGPSSRANFHRLFTWEKSALLVGIASFRK
jgi:hypothetical protein